MPTAVVTGANRGIGLELCRQLRERGYDVVGACRKSSADLQNTGARVVAGIDVTEAESVRRLAAELAPKSVDLLINNAGRLGEETLGSIDYQSVIDQFATNAIGPLRVTEALLPKLASGAKVALITSRMGSIADNTSGAFYVRFPDRSDQRSGDIRSLIPTGFDRDSGGSDQRSGTFDHRFRRIRSGFRNIRSS